jgi:hypothetical protein
MNKTPSSLDTQLGSDTSTTTSSSNYLQLPSTDISHNYPVRDSPSPHSRSTVSSLAKYKVYFQMFQIHFLYILLF